VNDVPDGFKMTELGPLPEDWDVVKLDDVGKIITGKTPSTTVPEYYGGPYMFISPGDINTNKYVISTQKWLSERGLEVSKSLPVDTVLVVCIGATIGKVAMTHAGKSATNQQINAIISDEHTDPQYLYYTLSHRSTELPSLAGRAAIPIVNKSTFAKFSISYPPFSEQQSIARVLSSVQEAREKTEAAIEATRALKMSMMKHLFTYGPAPLQEVDKVSLKETEIGMVPKEWDIIRCEDLCKTITVGIVVRPSSYYVPKGVLAFRSFNIREDYLNLKDLVFISEVDNQSKLAKSRLQKDDVLIVRTGYPGTACVVPQKFEGANCIDLVIARPNQDTIRSHYLSRFFNSKAGKDQSSASETGMAQKHLNVGAVKRTLIPLPSLAEQQQIVEILSSVDRKIEAQETKKAALDSLFQTLLQNLMTAKIRVNHIEACV
jgi:type I restriction enzyme S subunit